MSVNPALGIVHSGTINPPAQMEGAQLEDQILQEAQSSVRDVGYNQPRANVEQGADGPDSQQITGYKVTDQPDLARPITDQNRKNALRSVVEARQGLQTLGGYTTADPYDEMVELMKSVGMDSETGIIPGLGKVYVPPDHPYWSYAARKHALQFEQDFKDFMISQIDLTKPESRAYWEARFPQLTNMLRDGLRKNRLLRAQMEDIGLYGVQNIQDMWLLYMKEKGVAENEKDMIWSKRNGNRLKYQTPMGDEHPGSSSIPGILQWPSYLRSFFQSLSGASHTNENIGLGTISGPN